MQMISVSNLTYHLYVYIVAAHNINDTKNNSDFISPLAHTAFIPSRLFVCSFVHSCDDMLFISLCIVFGGVAYAFISTYK